MSLGHALNNAYSGLTVSSRRAEVTANNIANATTPGYIQRSLDVASVAIGGRGSGVKAIGVDLSLSPDLTADRRLADSAAGSATTVAEAAQTLARLIGEPDDPGALTERFSTLEAALRKVSDDPSASFLQADAVSKAKDLIEGFDDIQSGLNDLRVATDRQIGLLVDSVNLTLNEIKEINADIRKEVGIGGDSSELYATREGLINKLSEILPIKTYPSANDGIIITTDTGYTLVSESRVFEIGFDTAPTVTADMDLIAGAPGALSGLTMHSQDVTPPTSSVLSTGKLAGLFQVRDVETVAFQNQIDAAARDLIDRFEAVDATQLGLFVDPSVTRADDLSELTLNLPSGDTAAAGNIHTNETVYFDDDGAEQTLTVTFESTGTANEWTMSVSDSATDDLSNPISVHTLLFDSVGANAGYLNTVTNVSGDVYGASTAGAIELTLGGGGTVTMELGLAGAAGFLSQTTEDFGVANVPQATKGLASRLSLNPAVDPAQGGKTSRLRDGLGATSAGEAGQNAHAVALLGALTSIGGAPEGSNLEGNYSAFDLIAGISSAVSTKMLAAEESAALRTTRQTALQTAETSELGVDLDYELQELNLVQTAYAANARVLQTIDEMLARLLEI